MSGNNFPSAAEQRIDSWKAIASHFGRDERTVKRWESSRGLPVRRMPGARGGVFAYVAELDLWMNGLSTAAVHASIEDGELNTLLLSEEDRNIEAQHGFPIASQGLYSVVRFMVVFLLVLLLSSISLVYYAKSKAIPRTEVNVPSPSKFLSSPPSQAEEFYLKGKYYWNQRTTLGLDQAIASFEQALHADPSYAKGYAGIASAYDLMPEYGSMPCEEAFPKAISAASTAIKLDESLSEAHRALAFAQFYGNWDVRTSTAEFQRAIDLAPNDTDAHHWYATSLLAIGRISEAREQIEQARRLDPTSRSVLVDRAVIELATRDHDQGLHELQALEKSEPQFVSVHRFLAVAYLDGGDYLNFLTQLEQTGEFSGMQEEKEIAVAARRGWRRGGRAGMLEDMLTVYKDYFNRGKDSGYNVARIEALLGNRFESVAYLEAAFHAHDYMVMTIATGNLARSLGDYPPYRRLQVAVQESIAP